MEEEKEDAYADIEDKEGRKEAKVEVPPELEDDSESEIDAGKLVESDSDEEDEADDV